MSSLGEEEEEEEEQDGRDSDLITAEMILNETLHTEDLDKSY